MNIAIPFLVIIANILGTGMILPQVLRLHRTSSATGLSLPGTGVGIVMNFWWVVYALQAGVPGMIPVSVAGIFLYSIIALQCFRLVGGAALKSIVLGTLSIGAIPAVALLLADLPTAGLIIGLLYTVQFAPAAAAAITTPNPVGISMTTWSMALFEALIWLVYGQFTGDIALTVGGVGGSVMAGIIVVRLLSLRRVPELSPPCAHLV